MTLLTQAEVEGRIMDLDDRMDLTTHEFAELADDAAQAHADYRLALHSAILRLAAAKMTAQQREAQATLSVDGLYRADKIAAARLDACRMALLTYRSRLDALRSLSANIRAQT